MCITCLLTLITVFCLPPRMTDSKHEDGTQSDSENALGEQRRAAAMDERSWGLWGGPGMKIREGRANVPEGLFAEEDSPARRRKSSTSKVVGGFVERRRGSAPHQQSGRDECYHHGDDYSDRGTYTIELENGDHEEEEARKMIDKVVKVKPRYLDLVESRRHDPFHVSVRLFTFACVYVAGVWCG